MHIQLVSYNAFNYHIFDMFNSKCIYNNKVQLKITEIVVFMDQSIL